MAGHSHAANIAIKKGKLDRIRARIFSKLSKNIMVAARGGPDPDSNFSLRHAIELARAQSMPRDKIEHAIKKGAGLLEGEKITEALYEAYGPGGVAMLIEIVSDNLNRTRPEIANVLDKANGKFGASNSVKWMFKRRGLFAIKCGDCTEERLMEIVLGAGADDMTQQGDVFEVLTSPESFEAVQKALSAAGITPTVGETKYLADNEVELDPVAAQKVFKLVANLEDLDDVNAVHHNMKFTEQVLALLKAE